MNSITIKPSHEDLSDSHTLSKWTSIALDAIVLIPSLWAVSFFGAFTFGLSFNVVTMLFAIELIVALLFCLLKARRGDCKGDIPRVGGIAFGRGMPRPCNKTQADIIPLNGHVFLILLITVTAFYLLTDNAGIHLSHHGTFHSQVVYEILSGSNRLSNQNFHPAPINFYWVYHSWLALICKLVGVNPFRASALSNCYFLFVTLLAIWIIIRRWRYVGGFACVGLAWLILCWQPPILQTLPIPKDILGQAADWFSIPRLGIFNKFWNYNGFPAGIALTMYCLVLVTSEDVQTWLKRVVLLIALGAVMLFHPTSYLICGAILCTDSMRRVVEGRPGDWRTLVFYILIFIVGWTLYIRPITSTLGASTSVGFNWYGTNLLLKTEYLKLPLLLLFIKRIDVRQGTHFIFLGLYVILAIMTMLAHLPDGNEYKFVSFMSLISTLFLGLLIISRPCSVLGIGILVTGAAIGCYQAHLEHVRFWDRPVAHGKHYLLASDPADEELYSFIRQSTPANAVIHVKALKFNDHFQLPFTGRANFLVEDSLHTNLPDYLRVRDLSNWKKDKQLNEFLKEIESYNFPLLFLERIAEKGSMPPCAPVFSNQKYRLYPLNSIAKAAAGAQSSPVSPGGRP